MELQKVDLPNMEKGDWKNVLNAADLWNILDQFQSHLIDNEPDRILIDTLSTWMKELENKNPDMETM